jgi:hypothetical protein
MTLFDRIAPEPLRNRRTPRLRTQRLVLRAPRLEDAKTIASLVNDRRIAENTLRIPYPYGIADAQAFIAGANANSGSSAGRGPQLSARGVATRKDVLRRFTAASAEDVRGLARAPPRNEIVRTTPDDT